MDVTTNNDITREEFDKYNKERLFSRILEEANRVKERLESINEEEGRVGLDIFGTTKMPNIKITINNKLVELNQIFKKAGASIISQQIDSDEKYDNSYLGLSVINYILDKGREANEILRRYSSDLQHAETRIDTEYEEWEKMSLIKKGIAAMKDEIPILMCTYEERKKFEEYCNRYKMLDNDIWNYSLEKDVVDSVIYYIKRIKMELNKGQLESVLKNIYVGLEKLELNEKIPLIEQEISKMLNEEEQDVEK